MEIVADQLLGLHISRAQQGEVVDDLLGVVLVQTHGPGTPPNQVLLVGGLQGAQGPHVG